MRKLHIFTSFYPFLPLKYGRGYIIITIRKCKEKHLPCRVGAFLFEAKHQRALFFLYFSFGRETVKYHLRGGSPAIAYGVSEYIKCYPTKVQGKVLFSTQGALR